MDGERCAPACVAISVRGPRLRWLSRTMTSAAARLARTTMAVCADGGVPVEMIRGAMFPWCFRLHFHAGDEVALVMAGRARLRLGTACRDVAAGETVVVPAGAVHRFEPVDRHGWAFASRFVLRSASTPVAPSERAKRVLMLLAERTSLQTDVAALAGACAVSAGYLAREFRRETGTSLHHFHVLVALQKAKGLLREGAPVVEAALEAGFYDQAHLTRAFVRTLGMTPGAFRSAWAAAL